jgi:hypothetical protein
MNRKFFVLAFVSAVFFFGCSADGVYSSADIPSGPPDGGGPGSSWCVSHDEQECTRNPIYVAMCSTFDGTLMNSCPPGYIDIDQ